MCRAVVEEKLVELVDVWVLLRRDLGSPESALEGRLLDRGRHQLLNLAPCDRVQAPTSAVVHLGKRVRGKKTSDLILHLDWLSRACSGSLPSDGTEQVDADIDRHHIRCAVPLAVHRPQHSLPDTGEYTAGTIVVVHPARPSSHTSEM